MTLSLTIPPTLQIGAVDVFDARSGAVHRALQTAIERYLFADHAEVSESSDAKGASTTGPSFENIADKFSQRLDKAQVPRADVRALWTAMFGEADRADHDSGAIGSPKTAAFNLTLHALCGALAAERLGWASVEVPEEEAEELGEEAAEHEAEGSVGLSDAAWTLRSSARRAIAEAVRRSSRRQLEAISRDETVISEITSMVAEVMLSCLLDTMPRWFECRQEAKGAPRTIIVRSRDVARRIEALLAAIPYHFTPQPLSEAVRYDLGALTGARGGDGAAFRVDLVSYRRWNAFLQDLHRGAIEPAHRAPEFASYVAAVNMQMAVPWRINRPLLDIIYRLVGLSAERSRWDDEAEQAVNAAELGEQQIDDLQTWVRRHLYWPTPEAGRRSYGRPGEFLDHEQAHRVLDELRHNTGSERHGAFYLPWKADYRGRIYAETSWLTPQGGDVQRALFEFANGRPLDEAGGQTLRRHGGNLVAADHVIAHLEIADRKVLSPAERERWIHDHEEEILASAANPLRERFWRKTEVIDKPFQFLAFCLAYRQWKFDPRAPVHLPVQIDGTCNGLQHIAALTGDRGLARAVNVLPREDGLPGDIYSILAERAAEKLGNPAIEKGTHARGLAFGNRWLASAAARRALLDRTTAKKVVMTVPYGAGPRAQAGHVLDRIAENLDEEWAAASAVDGLDELVAWVYEPNAKGKPNKAAIDLVRKCTRGHFTKLKRRAAAGDDEAKAMLGRLSVLAAYVSLTIVEHLREALRQEFPTTEEFRDWLGKCADTCAGLPLAWLSPLGFPVCQDKFKRTGTKLSGRLGGTQITLDHQRLGEKVAALAQRRALLPNLIHSLDATHLAMTLLGARKRGIHDIGTIHDCLLCHPNDAATLSEVVRDSFAHLYRPDPSDAPAPLSDWQRWMNLIARVRQTGYAGSLIACIDDSSGNAAKLLRHQAKTEGRASEALELLPEIEALPPPQAWLLRQILIHVRDHYEAPKRGTGIAKARDQIPVLETTSLPLANGSDVSEYFFS